MEITHVKVTLVDDPSLKAIATLTLDGCFVIKGIKLVQGDRGVFVAMPSQKLPDGSYRDIAYPCTPEMAKLVRELVLSEYERHAPVREGSGR
jgi:stage V sporulation protein G